MTTTTTIEVAALPRLQHDEAMSIAAVESRKFASQLRGLGPEDWARPTDCARWDVRGVAAHVIGSAAGQASLREFIRQAWVGRPVTAEIGGAHWWDGMNEVQVRERAGSTHDALIAEWDTTWPRAVRARTKLPRPIARLPLLQLPAPVGRQPVAYLVDVGFTRDGWMHRIDLARATGIPLDLDPAHDGRIVADIVAEWAGTHGEPFTLHLTGPAGGSFVQDSRAPHVEHETHTLDAIEFARVLAERAEGDGVLRHKLPL
jgi:uncharacterized protein (TIGR03083 family)